MTADGARLRAAHRPPRTARRRGGGDRARRARASPRSRERAAARAPRRCRASPIRRSCPSPSARDEIAAAIRDHPVVIVCGETGSGKTTQLPKICLELGRGVRGLIGHTQPRRIAARSVAARIAQELGRPLAHAVGYKVRFTDRTGPDAYIKLMTDGILLAETQGDRAARRLRHDHRRRGARAQPQHRFPARLPEAAAAAAARPQGDHHLGDARRRALRAPLRHARDAHRRR